MKGHGQEGGEWPGEGTGRPSDFLTGRIHSVETGGTVDGPGIRYVAFLQGCPLRCLYCHNPDTWNPSGGQVQTSRQLVDDAVKYRKFIKNGGLTLTGGEPLMQAAFVREVFELARTAGIHTALDTSGIVPLEKSRPALEAADLVILDIKALRPSKAKALTGASNRHPLATLAFLETMGKPTWVRHVVVPGWTDGEEEARELARFLKEFTCVQKIELIPFHQMAAFKYEQLGRTYALKDTPPASVELITRMKEIFWEEGVADGLVS